MRECGEEGLKGDRVNDDRVKGAGTEGRSECVLLVVLWVIVAGCLLFLVAAGWPQYWRFVAAETTPLAWLESVLLVMTAAVAGLITYLEVIEGQRSRRVVQGWLVVALAFLWLALDERFALHERLRDRLLKPTGIKLLPWMEAGDWVIPIYMFCGLAAVWGIWRLLGREGASRQFFVAALVLAACAVLMDTIDVRSLDKDKERLLQSVEEGIEALAMTSFLSSFLCVWMSRLRSIIQST